MDCNVDDLKLPAACINKIIKSCLPPDAIVAKEAREAIGRAAAVFILHASAFANESAEAHNRRLITPDDVCHAVKVLECPEMEAKINDAVATFKSHKSAKKGSRKENQKAAKASHMKDNADASLVTMDVQE
ncbi:DNA polymerase epsilon p17 subunit [Aphelenchoides avenae]|nr:DNA polymerase epsilon p17 subunit [Aphelenchus avenae]